MPTPRWLTAPQMRAWLGYRRMHLLLDLALARELMSQSGLSEPDYDVLSNLSEAPEQQMRLTDLASHMCWSKSRLSHHVTRMQKRGLVERLECADDGRGSTLTLTPAGRQVIIDAAPGHVSSVREHFIDLLTDEEIEVFAEISHRVADRLGPSNERL